MFAFDKFKFSTPRPEAEKLKTFRRANFYVQNFPDDKKKPVNSNLAF